MASKKTIDQCLADFHGCMMTSTSSSAPAARTASAPAARTASAPAARTASAPAARAAVLSTGQAIQTAILTITTNPAPALTTQPTGITATGSFTLSIDINMTTLPNGSLLRVIGQGAHPGQPGLWLFPAGSGGNVWLRFHVGNSAVDLVTGTTPPTYNTYYNITAVYNAQTRKATLYHNGVLAGSADIDPTGFKPPTPAMFGWNQQNLTAPTVKVKNVYWFNKAMSAVEVATISQASAARAVSAPAASQYAKGAQNRANIEKVLNTVRANCVDANKKFATYIDSKGLIVVPETAACPVGTSKIADGPDSRPIAGFVPCVPTGKTAKDILQPFPDDIMKDLQACQMAANALTGKIVRIERADGKNEYINLLGIDVFGKNGAKITATPTIGPTIYANNPTNFGPQFLVDGVHAENGPAGLRLPHTKAAPASFMQLDLGSDKAISKIVIYNRTSCCMDRINGCVLKVMNAAGATVVTIPLTGSKAVYTFSAPITNGSMSSTYMMEGSPFVLTGYGGPGPNWKLILTLLVLAILLWILAKNM